MEKNKRISRLLSFGNLILDVSVDHENRKDLQQASKYFRKLGPGQKGKCYKLYIDFLDKSSTPSEDISDELVKISDKYVRYSIWKNKNPKTVKNIKSYFNFWNRSINFKSFIRNNHTRLGNDFHVTGLNSKERIIIVDTARKRGLIILKKTPHWKTNQTMLGYSIFLFANIVASTASSFILHCSALKLKDKGCLFIGESGAGKSTIARIISKSLKSARVVSDDHALISFDKNKFWVSKLPFEYRKIGKLKSADKIQLSNLYFIKKAKISSVVPMKKIYPFKIILERQLHNNSWFPGNTKSIPGLILKLVDKCHPQILYFRKDSSFIKLI